MPESSMNVYFSVIDGGSPVLARIGDKTKALDKETQALKQTYKDMQKANESLTERQLKLEKQLVSANEECKKAKKAYKALADEVNSSAYDEARQKQQKLQEELAETTNAIKDNEKAFKSNQEAIRKGGLAGGSRNQPNLAKGLMGTVIGQQFAYSLGGAAEAYLTSAIGTPEAAFMSGIASGAISGAGAGMAFGPWGALAGGALGALSGAIQGKTKIFEAQDDAFKDYYVSLYETARDATAEGISAGSTIAAGREKDKISFTTLFKDEGTATDFLGGLVDMANYTPFLYDDLTSMSKTLATYGFKPNLKAGEEGFDILDTLQTVGDAGAALGMATSDMNMVSTALGRMLSSNKTTLEYLNILNDRGIGAVGMLAEAKGMSVGDTYDAISKGEIAGTDAVGIILKAMEKAYSGSMKEQSRTFEGMSSTLEGLMQEIQNAGGEEYNTLRKKGVQDDIDAYGGELGRALEAVNSLAGGNQAYLENLGNQYTREALSAVLMGQGTTLFDEATSAELKEMGNQYRAASAEYETTGSRDAALKMEHLKEAAETMATAAYESSEQYQMFHEAELDQIAAIRESIVATENLTAALNNYEIQQEQSKGQGIFFQEASRDKAADLGNRLAAVYGYPSAYGRNTIPYDNFPILAHEGERLLTASETRAMDAGGGGIHVTVSGNTFTGTGEEMADQIADTIVRKLEQAAVAAAPR